MSQHNQKDVKALELDQTLKAAIAKALDFSEVYEHLESLEAAHRHQVEVIQNMIDNLSAGAFKVMICDDGAERDVTAETIANLKRITG
jgi:hypothetical protein